MVQKRVQLRSGVFLLAQLDADIDANAMTKVDSSRTETLSVEFTAVILEKDTKHKLPEASKVRTLKDLARVFTSSSNPHKLLHSS